MAGKQYTPAEYQVKAESFLNSLTPEEQQSDELRCFLQNRIIDAKDILSSPLVRKELEKRELAICNYYCDSKQHSADSKPILPPTAHNIIYEYSAALILLTMQKVVSKEPRFKDLNELVTDLPTIIEKCDQSAIQNSYALAIETLKKIEEREYIKIKEQGL